MPLTATARISNGDPRADVRISWASETPSVASVDAAGVVTGVAPGTATLRATAGQAGGTINIEVVRNTLSGLTLEPGSSNARTGDVIRFKAISSGSGTGFVPRWGVSGVGATVDAAGAFVAENPGTYLVTASIGDRTATASVVVQPRNAERDLEIVGRAPLKDVQGAEEWIIGDYAYFSTISDHFLVYDVSLSAGTRDRASLDRRRCRLSPESAILLGRPTAQGIDLFQRHSHWFMDCEVRPRD